MKNVILYFNGLGINQFYQACIYIYDSNKKLIVKDKTYDSKYRVCLKVNEVYSVKVIAPNYINTYSFYVLNSVDNYYLYYCNISRRITFLLTDNYYNMPIERGSLIIWPKQ